MKGKVSKQFDAKMMHSVYMVKFHGNISVLSGAPRPEYQPPYLN